jgi:hypothetical protein
LLEPSAGWTNQVRRTSGIQPVVLEDLRDGLFKLAEAGDEEAVADAILDDVPELFHRVEFRAAGWQGEDADVLRQVPWEFSP